MQDLRLKVCFKGSRVSKFLAHVIFYFEDNKYCGEADG